MTAMEIEDIQRKKWLLALILLNILVSLGHYIHNIIFLPQYHEPAWITPALIDSLWFVMTPLSGIGYILYSQGKFKLGLACLYGYCGMSLLVLGHYAIAPIWTLSLTINLVIFSEAIAAILLAGYLLQFPIKPKY
jgi:hypothetical protein